MIIRLAAWLVSVSLFAQSYASGAVDLPLDPDQPYRAEKSSPVRYDVDFSVVVTPPYHTRTLRVWLPLPQSDAGQEVTEGDMTTFPSEQRAGIAVEPLFGNRFAYFEFDRPEGAQMIRHRFHVKVWELRWNIDPERVMPVSRWPDAFRRYLQSEGQAVVVNDRVVQSLGEAVPDRRGPGQDLASIMRWVTGRMKYDHRGASLAASSLAALESSSGHCSDYHGLCASMSRALGYPARVMYGINPFPKHSPSHCKLELFLPPYGWVSFDVSETQRLISMIKNESTLGAREREGLIAAAERRLMSGFRDNTWFAQTRGTDYELAPPAIRRVSVVRTIYAEADGIPLPDPDPANADKREFAWMTIHKYQPDRSVTYPFSDWKSLELEHE